MDIKGLAVIVTGGASGHGGAAQQMPNGETVRRAAARRFAQ